MDRVVFSSQHCNWATPEHVYRDLDKEFCFDFDPCPLNSDFDGVSPEIRWQGRRVFCNPPYNRKIVNFLKRAREPIIAVYLLPSRTDTQWFHELVLPRANEIRFIGRRLKFGGAKHNAPFPSMVVIFTEIPVEEIAL